MPFPASLTTITVRGAFSAWPDGAYPNGTAVISSALWLTNPVDNVVVPAFDAELILDATGSFSVVLPATNDPDWSPTGWTYTVYLTTGGHVLRGIMSLPYDGASVVDFADVFDVGPVAAGQMYLLTAARGVAGGVASLGSDGLVPASQLPAGGGGSGAVDSVNGHTGVVVLTPTDLGLGNVNNTSDANKPISTATQTALNLKAPLASPTFTGTVSGITAAMVGLGNVNNTSDANKPISTATQTALNLKADLVGGVIPTAQIPAIALVTFLGSVANQTAMLALSGQSGDWCIRTDTGSTWFITGSDPTQLTSWTQLATPPAPVTSVNGQTGVVMLAKADVGLGNVDNTSDANKPISTATQAALDLKAPLASPALTGTPTAPTAAGGTNTTQLATTAFVAAAISPLAPLASPAFTGTPSLPTGTTAVTQTAGDNTTKLATTAFVAAAVSPLAPLASPTFTGTPSLPTGTTAVTQAATDSSTKLATTAFVAGHTPPVIVLGPVDPIPGGTAVGTVVIRKSS